MAEKIITYGNSRLTFNNNPIVYPDIQRPPVAVLRTPTGITSTQFTATWETRPITGIFPPIVGYSLDVSTDSNFGSFLPEYENKILSLSWTSDNVLSLSASTTYYYRVRHINEIGQSLNISPNSVTTLAPPVLVPVMLDTTNIHQTGFTANWTSVDGATEYRLWVALDSFFVIFPSGGWIGKYVGNVTTYNVDISHTQRYYFVKTKVSLSGVWSVYSNTIRVDLPAL